MPTYVVSQYCRISGFQLFMLISTTLLFKTTTENCFWCFEEEDQNTVAEFNNSCGTYNFTQLVNGGKLFLNRVEFWSFLRTYLHNKKNAIKTWKPHADEQKNVVEGESPTKNNFVRRLEVCFLEETVLVSRHRNAEFQKTFRIKLG